MNPVVIVLILATGGALAVAVGLLLYRPAAATTALGRLEEQMERRQAAAAGLSTRGTRPRASLVDSIRKVLAERDESEKGKVGRDRLAESLERGDVRLRPTEFRAVQVALGVLVGIVLSLRFSVVVGIPLGFLFPYFGGRFYLRFRHLRRLRAFDAQLSDVLILMANGLKAGYSFPQAMMSVATNAKPPTSIEFARTSREIQLGLPVDDALGRLVERNPSEDLDLAVTAVQIQRVVGGNLAEILDSISETIRERVRIKGEIRTLTAQARVSGWIISLLPIGLAGVLMLIAPDYFTPMFTETAGIIMLVVSLVSMAIGILIIRKIVDIKV